ncbi:hypothetical protein [Synechococcus sp. MIT S1220]|uniref:hypothetical protein n=1 Tax=Synechococcus sp. MIT S1220 TaxID=3082549 RepID=UPI0039B08AD1
MLFVDDCKKVLDSQLALLMSRRHLRKPGAIELRQPMKRGGWKPCKLLWHADAEV